jgi:hypothetical protein
MKKTKKKDGSIKRAEDGRRWKLDGRFALVPGHVRSSDGDTHFISAVRLAELYKLRPHEWFECDHSEGYCRYERYLHLRPSDSGQYGRPSGNKDGKD